MIAAALPAYTAAAEFTVGNVVITHPWSRSTPAVASTGAVFLTLSIRGDGRDRLLAADSPIAARVELHEHTMDNGVMMMRPVPGVDISAARPTVFEPGGLHVMLMGLREPLREGSSFPLTLTFEKAGSIEITIDVMDVAVVPVGHGADKRN